MPILQDSADEDDETLAVTLSSVTGGIVGTPSRLAVTIIDDDPFPSLSVSDVTQYEGHAGTTNAMFTVTLSPASGRTVHVAYATTDGTATAGGDYTAASSAVSFEPGVTTKTIAVPILGDGAAEPNETFTVTLSAPSAATLGDAQGLGTILNDDATRNTWGDFYAPRDGAADGAVFDVASNLWVFRDSNTGNFATFGPFGVAGDIPVPADYNGDGKTDCAVYTPAGNWHMAISCQAPVTTIGWGGDPTDVPVPGDYDGDGQADVAVFRKATGFWHVLLSATGTGYALEWGFTWTNSIPVPGDYDGDGRTDPAFFTEFNAGWYIYPIATGANYAVGFGGPGTTHLPAPADYDGDGKADIAFYHPPDRSFWFRRSTTSTWEGGSMAGWSNPGAIPVLKKPH